MRQQYKNPPIREAVCEFRFRSEGAFDIAVPGLVYNALRGEFPERINSPGYAGQLSITVGRLRLGDAPPGPPEARIDEAIRVGQDLRFWRQNSLDGIIVLGQDRLSISHYAPYRSWERFQPDILQALEAYNTEAIPKSVQRIGLRYINEIHIEQERVDLQDFFNYYPFLGEALPQEYVGLNITMQFDYEDVRDRLRLILAIRTNDEKTELIAQLDLDYSVIEPGTITVDGVPDWLEVAHDHIEEVFEGCLTDKIRLTFEEDPP